MAALKNCRSGITHGRGTDKEQRLIWLFSRPAFARLKTELEQLYKQEDKIILKELTESRINEDTKDILNILEYIEEHNPFNVQSEYLVDISTGISYPNANAHEAQHIGNAILKNMDGVEVNKYKFKKADRIKQMGEKVLVGKEEVVLDPLMLCERALLIADNSDISKKYVFEHELSLNPPSLFGTNGLIRYADDKSNLTDLIAKKYQPQSLEDRTTLQIERTVIDMGSYLRTRVNFNKGETYKVIIQKLVSIVKMYPNPVAVFDGYNDDSPSTKYMTHLKRLKKVNPSHTVELALNLPFNFNSKTEFFANKRNKQSFINLMSEAMKSNGIEVDHVTGDADQLIAERAIDAAVTETTQVIGEDTDIFQLLVSQLISDSKGLYMITEKQNAKHPFLDIQAIRNNLVMNMLSFFLLFMP